MGPNRVYLILEGIRGLGLGLLVTAPIYRIESAGFGPLELVLAGTALEVAYFVSEVPTGVLADLYSRRLSCIVGAFVMGAGWLIEGSFASLVPIMIGQVLLGSGWTFFSGAAEAWIAGEVGESNAAHAIVRGGQANLGSSVVGGFIGAGLATFHLNWPIFVAGVSHVALGVFLIVAMRETGFVRSTHENQLAALRETIGTGARAVRRNRVLLVILVTLFLTGMASEGLDRLWEAHLYTDYELPNLFGISRLYLFAFVAGVATTLSVIALSVSRRFVESEGDRTLAVVTFAMVVMVAAGTMVFGTATGVWIAIAAYWVVRIGRNVLEPVVTVWAVQHTDPAVRATVLSIHGQSHSIGEVISGPVLGGIGSALSIPAALVASGILEACALPLLGKEAVRPKDD